MKAPRKTALLSLLLFPAFSSARAENIVKFEDLPYPIKIEVAAGQKEGAVIFETPYSAPPPAGYDTVLIQGDMPDPDMRIDFALKSDLLPPTNCPQTAFHRFPNGRFWAKYRIPLTRQPLKLSVVNLGAKSRSTITIYEAEILVARLAREAPAPRAAIIPYVPDPAFFLPETAPLKLIRRAAWQAAPPAEPYTPHTPAYFTLHHTQSKYPATYEGAVSEIQFVQDYHQNAKGWIDIGYHFLIDPAGNIFEGRPIGVVGAHVKWRNTGNIGISLMGDFHPPVSNEVTRASEDSFVAIGRYLKDTYTINVSSFYAHRDLAVTECPGDILYAKKTELSGLIFNSQPQPLPVNPADAPPMTPAQRSALDLLIKTIGTGPQ